MKQILFFIISVISGSIAFGQSFEGKLTYKVEIELKSNKIGEYEITKDQLIQKMKKEGEFFDTIKLTIKNGDYIKEDNSSLEKKYIYKSDSNKIYTFQNNLEHESIIDANKYNAFDMNFEEPKVENIDSLKVINGINCKLLKLSWGKMGDEYYFYNPEFIKLDPNLFKAHNYEYFNTVIGITNSYPIEIIKTVFNLFTLKMTLLNISPENVSDELFDIEKIKAQKSLYFQNKKTTWKEFSDKDIGYTVEYPESWIAKGSKGSFMCGQRAGLANAEFTIYWSDVKNTERIDFLFNDEGLYQGYDVIEKPININGLDGVYYLKTNKKKPNEYHESIILKTESIWYVIRNSGVKNNWFEQFYKSFKLTK